MGEAGPSDPFLTGQFQSPSSSRQHQHQHHQHHQHDTPSVTKAGSSCSPAVLSPMSERSVQLGPLGGGGDHGGSAAPLSSWDSLPVAHTAGFLPLASPSEEAEPGLDETMSRSDTSMADAIPAGAPTTTTTTSSSATAAGHGLRLPSFASLGIAFPHPDNISPRSQGKPLGVVEESLSMLGNSHVPNFVSPPAAPSRGPRSPFGSQQREGWPPPGWTPPGEASSMSFTPLVDALATPPWSDGTGRGSMSSGGPTRSTSAAAESPRESQQSGQQASAFGVATGSDGAAAGDTHTHTHTHTHTSTDTQASGEGQELPDPWMQELMQCILRNVSSTQLNNNAMRVLSHALPSPSVAGHVFSAVINAVRLRLPPNPLTWINVFHAVPGRFTLADLPTSPPNTPGQPLAGEDYFSTKVFDSAVPITDYENDLSVLPLDQPHPAVPPSSVNLGILERFIPPATRREFGDMFEPSGSRSILADRAVELSPDGGSLVFIYPTQRGGQTFLDEYLGPILDPILRSMVVVHGFTSDFSLSLGRMTAVDALLDFDTLAFKTRRFCTLLSRPEASILRRLQDAAPGSFSVQYAAKHDVVLGRKTWSDWWVKQEKARVRLAVQRYFRNVWNKSSSGADVSQASLVQDVLDGVANRRYSKEPSAGVEVGVFVITRQRAST